MKIKKIGIVLRHAPYGNQLSQDAIDTILATSVYGQPLTLIFMADGIFQLLDHQHPDDIQQKSFQKQLSAFGLYDIDTFFVCEQSLTERGLTTESLSVEPTLLNTDELKQLLHQQDAILSF